MVVGLSVWGENGDGLGNRTSVDDGRDGGGSGSSDEVGSVAMVVETDSHSGAGESDSYGFVDERGVIITAVFVLE